MTTHTNLPVYKTTYDLLINIFSIVGSFSREYKYTLGDKIKHEIIDLTTSIYRANSSFDNRLVNIKKAREQVEVLRLYMRLCKDLKLVNINKFVKISESIESISKQLFAWEKNIK